MLNRLQDYLLSRTGYQENISLTNKNIYILPTKVGLFFALILLLMLLTAINFSNSLIYLLTFFLASVAIVSMLFTQKSLLGLSFQANIATPVFCRQISMVPLMISVPSHYQTLPSGLNIKVKTFSQTVDVLDQQEAIMLPIKSSIRGYIKIPPITVSSTFPFGLFYAWSTIKLSNQSLVYPQPLKTDSNIQLNQLNENSSGFNQNKGMEDFSGLDKFINGQSLKQVHWKAYAKQQGLYIKTFSGGEKSNKFWFDIELFESFTSLEQRLGYLTYFIIQADKNGDSYGLKMYQQTININSGNAHKHCCLKALALA
ncbi:MAG: DUF58 domain-containing protein [Pseudomonadota bacterium]